MGQNLSRKSQRERRWMSSETTRMRHSDQRRRCFVQPVEPIGQNEINFVNASAKCIYAYRKISRMPAFANTFTVYQSYQRAFNSSSLKSPAMLKCLRQTVIL